MKTEKMCNEKSLICPSCKNGWLHQRAVRVFFRAEDAKDGVSALVDASGVSATYWANQEANPSLRRDGVAIQFDCETCDAVSVMQIVQHKGNTHIGWVGGGEVCIGPDWA